MTHRRSPGAAIAAALAAMVLLVPSAAGAVQRLAVLVGHNHGGPDEKVLHFALQDAEKLRDVLLELGSFEAGDAVLLSEPRPTDVRQALIAAMHRFRESRDPETMFLFYYSGHADKEGLKLGRQRLDLTELKRLVAGTGAKVRVLLLDSCRSGAITREKGGRRGPAFEVSLDERLAARGQVLIASSSENEVAQESEDLNGSFFTHYLASGLRGDADRSGDGQVTLGEAYGYAYHHTVEGTSETRAGSQHPTYRFDIAGAGDIVLTNLAEGKAALLFPRGAAGDFLVWNRENRTVVAEVHLDGSTTRRLALRPGEYVVKRRMEDHLELAEIELDDGDVKRLDLDAMEEVDFADDVTKGPSDPPFEISLGARVGFQEFFNARTRTDLIAPVWAYGIEVALRRFPADFFDLKLEVSFTRGEQTYRLPDEMDVVGTFNELNVGLSMPYVFRWKGLALYGGPRIAGLYLVREFPRAEYSQDYFSISPGLVVGVGYAPIDELRIEAEYRINYLYVKLDDESRNLGYYEIFAGLSWGFGI